MHLEGGAETPTLLPSLEGGIFFVFQRGQHGGGPSGEGPDEKSPKRGSEREKGVGVSRLGCGLICRSRLDN